MEGKESVYDNQSAGYFWAALFYPVVLKVRRSYQKVVLTFRRRSVKGMEHSILKHRITAGKNRLPSATRGVSF